MGEARGRIKLFAVLVLIIGVAATINETAASANQTAVASCRHGNCASPTVTILSPSNNSSVSGTIVMSGSSSDSNGIARVEVAVDSGPYQLAIGTLSWTFAIEPNLYSNASHTITARVTDNVGNVTKKSVSVAVNNGASSSIATTTTTTTSPTTTTTVPLNTSGHTWYVSRTGTNADGSSWATAWSELANINWPEVQPGDTIVIDGGATACGPLYNFTTTRPGVTCGMEYDTTLTVESSGITIRLATDAGRNGTAVIFGGRGTPLPYCHQINYAGSTVRQYGVVVNGNDHVTIDGTHPSGFMVYGAETGVLVANSAGSNLFERMEVFDNGIWNNSSGGGVTTDGPGFLLGASPNTVLRGDIIHDNGQDEVHDATRPDNSLNGLTLDTDWLFATREHPSYPGGPFNDLQAVGDNTCTHSDGLQLWNGGASQSGLTVTHSVFGPLTNQGLYPSDGTTGATWTNVTVTDSLFLAIRHNIITDNPVNGWTLDHDTIFAEQGGFEIPANGPNAMTNVVKYNGYVSTPSWSGTTSGDDWYSGDPLPGSAVNQNPNFVGPVPSSTLNGFSAYAAANFSPQCSGCQGSSLHSLLDILYRIQALS